MGVQSPAADPTIDRLLDAIIAKRTTRPLVSRAPLDPRLIADYWRTQPANDDLSLDELRAKALTLFALVKFLRPSDAARLNRTHMRWTTDGKSCQFTEWGFKNDRALVGNAGFVPSHREQHICPRTTLWAYYNKTKPFEDRARAANLAAFERKHEKLTPDQRPPFVPFVPLFMSLRDGRALSADTCAKIMKKVATRAGADPAMFSAGSYRKGGADHALANGMSERDVQWIGKWKNKDVFERHYVSVRAPVDYAEHLFGVTMQTNGDDAHRDLDDDTDNEEIEADYTNSCGSP